MPINFYIEGLSKHYFLPEMSNMAFSDYSASTSTSTSTTSESSLFSSPCSSPTFSLSSQAESSALAVPFSWEHKPGVTKPSSSSSSSSSSSKSTSTSTHILYVQSLESPPLPPPPRLSQAFLSQPRRRQCESIKLPAAPSFNTKKTLAHTVSLEKPSISKDDDPFFLAFKACTRENKSSRQEKARFDGLQAALRGFFKSTRKDHKVQGSNAKVHEDSESHHTSREGSSLSASGKLEPLDSQNEIKISKLSSAKDEARMRTWSKDEHDNGLSVLLEATVYKRANEASNGSLSQMYATVQKAKQGEPLQGVARKSSRKENSSEAHQGHSNKSSVKGSAKVAQCDESVEEHSKHLGFTDLLGCRAHVVAPAIHPSLLFPRKLFASHHH